MNALKLASLVTALGLASGCVVSGSLAQTSVQSAAPLTSPASAASPSGPNVEPKDFIRQAYLANEFGILASQLALKNSTNATAKTAAQTVLTDALKVRTDMVAAIQQSSSDMHFDQTWDAHYKDMLAALQTTKGPAFDKKYLTFERDLTSQTADMFGDYAQSGTDAAVKSFAANDMSILQADSDKLKASIPTEGV